MPDPQTMTRSKAKPNQKQAEAAAPQQMSDPEADCAVTVESVNEQEVNTMSIQQAISNALASALAEQTQLMPQTIKAGLQRLSSGSGEANKANIGAGFGGRNSVVLELWWSRTPLSRLHWGVDSFLLWLRESRSIL
ncbi:hypothetical protein ACLKA7_000207 [Drosophila subpalustris]